jgi:signal transduction histidine kinase
MGEGMEPGRFAGLVALACHDLRTPLATVHGFARTMLRPGTLGEPAARYTEMIAEASMEMAELVDTLALVARIESGRYEPARQSVDTVALARSARERLDGDGIEVRGTGVAVAVDPAPTERALAAFVDCARRHGGVDLVTIAVEGEQLTLSPVPADAAPVILGEELKDLGAAAARILVEAYGGAVEHADDALVVRLPA